MRRLAAIIPGPINAIYGETIAGTAVIRAFGVQSVFIEGALLPCARFIQLTSRSASGLEYEDQRVCVEHLHRSLVVW